jgi:hypothetical protein
MELLLYPHYFIYPTIHLILGLHTNKIMRKILEQSHTSILLFLTVGLIVVLCWMPTIGQDSHYHLFADRNTLMGFPNFMNVISNAPFVIIGLIGFLKVGKITQKEFPKKALMFFFAGVFLTGFGSAYYHWQPDNQSLLWDRLPMTIAFMSLFSAIISFHMDEWSGEMLLFPLLILGVGSVVYWYGSEVNGYGDLRPYLFVQFYPVIFIPLIAFLFPIKGVAIRLLLPMIGCYVMAKFFEYYDKEIYQWSGMISGHTIKHLFAAMATYPVLRMKELYKLKHN